MSNYEADTICSPEASYALFRLRMHAACMQPACRLHAGCMQAAFERMQPAYARMQAAFARIFSWPSVFCPAYFGKIRPDLACEITAYFARRIFLFLEWPDQSAITCIISDTTARRRQQTMYIGHSGFAENNFPLLGL